MEKICMLKQEALIAALRELGKEKYSTSVQTADIAGSREIRTEKYLTLRDAVIIATLKGPEYKVQKNYNAFLSDPWVRGEFQFSVEKIVKRDVGRGRLPRRVLIRSLNAMNARLPRTKEWHRIANTVVANMSLGMLARCTYASLARNIKSNVDASKKVKKKPVQDTIEHGLKTHDSVNDQILYFRDLKRDLSKKSG
jgi:hypothetical protein